MIRVWTRSGEKVKEWQGHEDIIREFCEVKDVGFVSVSNDETGKVWTMTGDLIYTLAGHTGFVFSCFSLENGDVATGSDDRTVKIWRDGACVQTLSHP